MWRRLLGLVVAASVTVSAWAHGFMSVPVSRNINSGTYCDMCLNAGGTWAVYGTGKWPNGKHGACGDPASGEGAGYHEGGGKFEKTVGIRVTYYRAGDTIMVKGKLTANHLGYMQYYLCVLPANSAGGSGEKQVLTEDCFRKNLLKVNQDGAWTDRYYVSGSLSDFSHSLKLPDFECPRCVLRWYYLTGNSCTPPGTPAKWAASNLVPCGGGGANPEEFWNCADIALLKKGASLPAQSKLAVRGELSSGVSSKKGSPDPADQQIEDTTTGHIYENGGGGSNSSTLGDLVSFEDVMISVVVGTGVGLPAVLVSPTMGTLAGMCAFVVAMAFFMIRNGQADK